MTGFHESNCFFGYFDEFYQLNPSHGAKSKFLWYDEYNIS